MGRRVDKAIRPPDNGAIRPPNGSAAQDLGAEPLSRRSFLRRAGTASGFWVGRSTLARGLALSVSAVGGGAVLQACSNATVVAPTLVPLFSPDRVLVAGVPQRIPFGMVAADPSTQNDSSTNGVRLPTDDQEVTVTVMLDGEPIEVSALAGRVVDHDHVGDDATQDHQHASLFRYYPIRATMPKAGIYDLVVEFEDDGDMIESTMPFQVFDQASASVLYSGQRFPTVSTPTFEDSSGVDRLCTRLEPCPFHTTSVVDLLTAGTPFVLLVATPAFCSTAYCGPVLDTLIEAHQKVGGEIVHVEVYANTNEVNGNFQDPNIRLAPAVTEIGLEFEPSLFVVSAEGTIVDRIDNIFDQVEAEAALQLALASS